MLGGLTGFLRSYAFTLTGYRVVKRLRCQLFEAIISQDCAYFDETNTGDLLSRLSSDCQVVQQALTVNISMFVRFSFQAIGSMILLVGLSWKLSLIMFSC
jgi:ABC-type multidrug transport system fused ATPase/permease subunit